MPEDNEVRQKKKEGPPFGSKNARGNSGGSAPLGNKNAVATGEFEKILFDSFSDDELSLANGIQSDEERLLLEEIIILCVRERRMLKRIDGLINKNPKGMAVEEIMTVSNTPTVDGDKAGRDIKTTKIEPVMNQVHRIEEALTRVQARKEACIDLLYRMKSGQQDSGKQDL
jgi:uncharacterized protein YjcR